MKRTVQMATAGTPDPKSPINFKGFRKWGKYNEPHFVQPHKPVKRARIDAIKALIAAQEQAMKDLETMAYTTE